MADTLKGAKGKTLCKKLGDVEAVAVLETLHHNVALPEIKTLEKPVGDRKAEKLSYEVHDTPLEAKAKEIGYSSSDMKHEARVNTLTEKPIERNAETFGIRMGDEKTKPSKKIANTAARNPNTKCLKSYQSRRPKHFAKHCMIWRPRNCSTSWLTLLWRQCATQFVTH